MKGERIRILFLRDLTGESWQVGIPLSLFRFLVGSFVVLVILTGATITWLGSIAIKLQAAEMVSQENTKLRNQLDRVGILQEELKRIEEREKALNTLTQSFLDDPVVKPGNIPGTPSSSDIFNSQRREQFLSEIRLDLARREALHRAGNDTARIPLLLSPMPGIDAHPAPGLESEPGKRRILSQANAVIRAPLDGVVEEAGWSTEQGWHAKFLLAEGWSCTFSDLGQIEVQPGDLVRRGDPIGRTQRTGGENSSHFVVTLFFHGLAIDPLFAMMR